jgi:hypothetical protein
MTPMKRVSQAFIMVALFSVLNLAGSSEAAFYKYVDKNGGVHFTDQIDSIPPEYRHQIKEYRDRQPAETPSAKETEASKEPGAAERERQLKEAEQKKEAEAKAQQEKAAREEKEKVFKEKEKEISELQEQITAKQQEQRSLRTNWMVYDKIRLNQLNEDIAGLEKQIEEIKKETPE